MSADCSSVRDAVIAHRARRIVAKSVLSLALTACAPLSPQAPAPAIRHVQSTEPYGRDARWHLFLFDPAAPRALDERIALARAAIDRDPDCAWVSAPRDQIVQQTDGQGAKFAQTTLAHPLRCRT